MRAAPRSARHAFIFSDNLKPDDRRPAFQWKIQPRPEAFARARRQRPSRSSTPKAEPDTQRGRANEGRTAIGVVLHYGVTQPATTRRSAHYYARLHGLRARQAPTRKFIDQVLTKPWDKLPLEILRSSHQPKREGLWQGKPVATPR